MIWEHERANTSPANFTVSKESTHIEVATPGLYAVACSFFTAAGPTVSVVVNDAVVFRRVG